MPTEYKMTHNLRILSLFLFPGCDILQSVLCSNFSYNWDTEFHITICRDKHEQTYLKGLSKLNGMYLPIQNRFANTSQWNMTLHIQRQPTYKSEVLKRTSPKHQSAIARNNMLNSQNLLPDPTNVKVIYLIFSTQFAIPKLASRNIYYTCPPPTKHL